MIFPPLAVLAGRRLLAVVTATALAVVGFSVPQPAHADTAPAPGLPTTVSADGLPTWQINGVVWSQVIAGNTVYATGSFTKARPPGVPVGGAGEIDALNIFAYDVTTGARVASFSHALNAQGMAIAASPDGSKVIVGGDFTTVDGASRSHLAIFDTASNALSSVATPYVGGQVRALAATNTTVYAGGSFMSAGGLARTRLGQFSLTNGAVLPWAPTADDNAVWSMVLAPGGSRVIVGGAFTTLNGLAAYGMGSLDATSGTSLPWAANQVIRDAGTYGAITTLRTDGTQIYGAGYAFGAGASFEGNFAAEPTTGTINWLNDCHGDTYDVLPLGQVLYSVSHAHDCSAPGEFPETSPRTWHRALAWTTYPTGTNTGPDAYGWNYNGRPDSTLLQWYPTLLSGSYTGQYQGAWSAAGNASYVVLGGEFPSVNGVAQQGLVRFAVKAIAPNKRGPVFGTTSAVTATSPLGGTAKVGWGALWDMDNALLTYDVLRDGASFVYSTKATSNFWTTPSMGFLDKGLAGGSTHTYQVRASDPFGNIQWSAVSSPVTISSTPAKPYVQDIVNDGASSLYRLDEASGTPVEDLVGFADATGGSGLTRGQAGALIGDPDTATTFGGSTSGTAGTNTAVAAPQSFSIETWFKTTSVSGGEIVGFGSSNSGNSSTNDRTVYLDNLGHVSFGVNPGTVKSISSSGRYNDGVWHHVVAILGAGGMALDVDGVQVAQDASTSAAQARNGYWRIGGDNLSGWPSMPLSGFLSGTIDEVALYPAALTLTQVRKHYTDSGRSLAPVPPTAAFTFAVTNLSVAFDGSGSTAGDGSIASWAWDFGDGSTGTGATTTRSYGAAGTYSVKLTVTDTTGGTGTSTRQVTVSAPPANQPPTAAFTSRTTNLSVAFDGSGSSDPDGTVASYAWNFGDGGTSTVVSPNHPYAAAGTYQVKLTVTDNAGATNAVTHPVTVAAANQSPTAAFTSTASGLTASFDGTGSSDPDGTIASYKWDFGDGGTSTAPSPSHPYAAAGTFQVTLAVTDNQGATGSVTQPITVSTPTVVTLASDDFNRTLASGWGSADLGGAWSTGASLSNFSVGSGAGTIKMAAAGSGPSIYLNSVSSNDTDLQLQVATDKVATGNGAYLSAVVRKVAGVGDYRAKVRFMPNGVMRLAITYVSAANVETALAPETTVPGLTYTLADTLEVRVRATGTGPTALLAKVWKTGATEPGWLLSGTDGLAGMQVAGGIGTVVYLSSTSTNAPVLLRVNQLRAYRASTMQ